MKINHIYAQSLLANISEIELLVKERDLMSYVLVKLGSTLKS